MQKIKLILQLVREILQFKYPAFWLVEKILDHNINLTTIFTDTEFAKKTIWTISMKVFEKL